MTETGDVVTVTVSADTSAVTRELGVSTQVARQFARTMSSAFDGLVVKGKGFGEVLRGVALQLSRIALQAAFKPLEQGIAGLLSGAVSGGSVAFAKGGIIDRGLPVPFAAGGVIRQPISFPLSGGRTGIAGERGAEAILPLARGPDGQLGVAAAGGGGGASIVFNVTTPDVEGFRRSQSQIAAMIARTAAAGQRGL